jgi:hypothetical protein
MPKRGKKTQIREVVPCLRCSCHWPAAAGDYLCHAIHGASRGTKTPSYRGTARAV